MKIHYDKEADAMYIYLRKGKIDETIEISSRVFADIDEKGDVIGIEILDVSHQIPKEDIGKIQIKMPVYP